MNDTQDKKEEVKTAQINEQIKKVETAKAAGGVKDILSFKARQSDAK